MTVVVIIVFRTTNKSDELIIRTACVHCGRELEPATFTQRTHPTCSPPADTSLAVLAAVRELAHAKAAELAGGSDQAATVATGLIRAALAYARHGWPVFPCVAGGKTPATSHGFQDATTDSGRIRRWWTRHPDSNIGIATGHAFDVIDIDYTGKPAALEWWERTKALSDLEIDGLATTPRGLHAFLVPTGAGNSSKLFGINGVDYRGIGGYVVVAPSVREDGRYQWWVRPSPRIIG